jgi:CheY-like chemotaxis protein
LKEYLSAKHENVLRRAAELGKKAIVNGLGILDIATIHRESMAAIFRGPITAEQSARAVDFFTTSLGPFEAELAELRKLTAGMRVEPGGGEEVPPASIHAIEGTEKSEAKPAESGVKPLRVLLIEDSEDILFLMTAELEWLGYSVLAATDAKAGMELAIREKPDLLISDIKMPGVDGYDLIRSLRRAPEFGTTPAIALTGFGMERDVERTLEAGYDAHLSKPADSGVLNDLIKKLTAAKR